jgi:hypothetical protein
MGFTCVVVYSAVHSIKLSGDIAPDSYRMCRPAEIGQSYDTGLVNWHMRDWTYNWQAASCPQQTAHRIQTAVLARNRSAAGIRHPDRLFTQAPRIGRIE